LILVTGATGYIGTRLLAQLERQQRRVRCLARRPESLGGKTGPMTETARGDVLDPTSLRAAMQGVETAYYLVHSMGEGESFEEKDRQAATNFAEAAAAAGVRRIVYLGGLGDASKPLSPHLRSRIEVGEIFRQHRVESIEFRASIVIGAGSLSFEMIRALVERLPVMIAPRWVDVPAQPISIRNLLGYLAGALELPATGHRIYEIGGSTVTSYGELMLEYARQRGLRRLIIAVPVLTPYLSSLWLGFVTPLYAKVGRILIDSIRHPTVVTDSAASRDFPIRPVSAACAIRDALDEETRTHQIHPHLWMVDRREKKVSAPPEKAFAPILRIGGRNGWYYANSLWRLRGAVDRMVGGAGMNRGRRDPERLTAGDVVDCWRVQLIEPHHRLRLAAEMKLPGRAWLEFEVEPQAGGSVIRQTAIFDPRGLLGRVYWCVVAPLHQILFQGMLDAIAARAEHSRRLRPVR
jgi:uncharacterized protein YbjT (DUF2867 family)